MMFIGKGHEPPLNHQDKSWITQLSLKKMLKKYIISVEKLILSLQDVEVFKKAS